MHGLYSIEEIGNEVRGFLEGISINGYFRLTVADEKFTSFIGAGCSIALKNELKSVNNIKEKIIKKNLFIYFQVYGVNLIISTESMSSLTQDVLIDGLATFSDIISSYIISVEDYKIIEKENEKSISKYMNQLESSVELLNELGEELKESVVKLQNNINIELIASFTTLGLENDQEEFLLSLIKNESEKLLEQTVISISSREAMKNDLLVQLEMISKNKNKSIKMPECRFNEDVLLF